MNFIQTAKFWLLLQFCIYHQLFPGLLESPFFLLLVHGDAAMQVDHEVNPCNKLGDMSTNGVTTSGAEFNDKTEVEEEILTKLGLGQEKMDRWKDEGSHG